MTKFDTLFKQIINEASNKASNKDANNDEVKNVIKTLRSGDIFSFVRKSDGKTVKAVLNNKWKDSDGVSIEFFDERDVQDDFTSGNIEDSSFMTSIKKLGANARNTEQLKAHFPDRPELSRNI